MLQVTSREFRENQAAWFDRAGQGGITVTPELEQKIAKARQAYLKGETVSCKSADEAIRLLESL